MVEQKENQSSHHEILKNLDVIIAILGQVKLNKQNQLVLMKGIRVFITDFKTKKKAYKLLAKIVEKYEIEDGF